MAFQPIAPRQTIARTVGSSRVSSRCSHGAQVARSSGVGLFSGGAQRTVATIRVCGRRCPSPAWVDDGWVARPVRCSAAWIQSPERSPVKLRPVRLAPLAAGARPTMSTPGVGEPQPGTGRPQYGSPSYDARFCDAAASRQPTSRGQARHTEIRAESSSSVGRAASRATPAAERATGVSASAGSPGQPVPGGTGVGKSSPVTGCGRVTRRLT